MRLIASIVVAALLSLMFTPAAVSLEKPSIDEEIQAISTYMGRDQQRAGQLLEKLGKEKANFSQDQEFRFTLLLASFYGYTGRHKERIALVQSILDRVTDPNQKAKFLYLSSYSYTATGEYEKALQSMNQSVLLIPKITQVLSKVDVLQSAIALLSSLRAYDEALEYANRMSELPTSESEMSAKCYGLTNQVEISFLMGERARARNLVPEAESLCEKLGLRFVVLVVKANSVVDFVDSGNYLQGIGAGTQLLADFEKITQKSDYVTQLEEALARAYFNTGNLELAERFGLQAYRHAKAGSTVLLMEKTAETLANIKRAQGQFANALEYFDAAFALKNQVLDDQLHKNLAYQRVKFDTQDKANQLNLLEQKNKILSVERELEKKNNQNLWLAMTLVATVLILLSIWLMKTLRQKDQFRQSSQIDGLTQAASRTHFMTCAHETFKMRTGSISIILFDMDLFKNINDTYGHATGDWVLKNVGETVKAHLRKVDLFGRLGGEEFGICMPDSNALSALQLAERCRAAIALIDTEPSGHAFTLAASFGVATVDSNGLNTFEATLEAADKALYRSKADGRNCVSVFQQAA